jgi:hypothetical protein
MIEALRGACAGQPSTIVDVDGDPDARARYGTSVPVLVATAAKSADITSIARP